MKNGEVEKLFERWRYGDSEAWPELKPHLVKALKKARPALNLPPEHMVTIRSLLCLRMEMADEMELRRIPGRHFWEFYAALTRRFLVELLREGVFASKQNDAGSSGARAAL